MKILTWSLLVLGLVAPAARADVMEFTVNAQYRGLIKKSFPDIGGGRLTDTGKAAGEFRISGRADVTHPTEKGREYHMELDMSFSLEGGRLREMKNGSSCNKGAEQALRTTEKILPFVHVAKWASADKGEQLSYHTSGGSFTLKFGRTKRNLEATLLEDGQMVGKFFMFPGNGLPRAMEKFRITTKQGTVLSFVAK